MPALWQAASIDDLTQVMVRFRDSRSDVENLTSAMSQLPTLSPPEREHVLGIVLGDRPRAEVAELLSTLLAPLQLGALPT